MRNSPSVSRVAIAIALAGGATLAAGCSSPTLPSHTIIIPAPTITCPAAPLPVTSSNGQSAVVTYGSATVAGGTTPVTVSCTPASGSAFNVGSTPVACTATDAVRRTASCSFAATVTSPSPRLGVTTILAFGDSITAGEVPVAGEFSIRPQLVMPGSAYPASLTTLLAQFYTAQRVSRLDAFAIGVQNTTICGANPPPPTGSDIVVINAGCLGEHAAGLDTLARLIDKISTYHPDVLLLLEGVNDLDSQAQEVSVANGVEGVRRLIAAAQSRNVRVMVGTLLPIVGTNLTHGGAPELIVPFNTQLVPVATTAGARVVDLYSAIAMDVRDWISPYDGLHPTEAGYQEIALTWFNALRSGYEQPFASTASTRGTPRPGRVVRRRF